MDPLIELFRSYFRTINYQRGAITTQIWYLPEFGQSNYMMTQSTGDSTWKFF